MSTAGRGSGRATGAWRPPWEGAWNGRLPRKLLEKLAPAIRRKQWACSLEVTVSVQLVGILLVAGLLLLQLVVPMDLSTPLMVAVALLGGGVIGLGYGWLRRPSLFEVAVLVDRRLGLRERMATLLELLHTQPSSPFLAPLLVDALSRLEAREVARAFPVSLPRRTPWLILALAGVLAWELALTGLTIPGTPAYQVVQRIREEGKALEEFARELEQRGKMEVLPETRRLSQKLAELGRRFQGDRLERVEALKRVTQLSRELDTARNRLQERLKAEGIDVEREPPADLLRRLDALTRRLQSLREGAAPPQEREVGRNLRTLLRSLDKLQQEGEGLPPGLLQTLQEARRNLEKGDLQGAAGALESAEETAQALRRLLADEEGLSQARGQLQRSAENIARGGAVQSSAEAQTSSGREGGVPPRSRSPGLDQGIPGEQEPTPPSLGPYSGTEPGTGRVVEFSGPPTPRLNTHKTPSQLHGSPGEGQSSWTEVVGKGEESRSLLLPRRTVLGAMREADRYMGRARIPAPFREVVRRYFQELAR